MDAISIMQRLREEVSDYSPGLQRAAKYIIDHPVEFGLDPIRETAARAGVSTYSLVRLAENLGLEGFDALRDPFRKRLREVARSSTTAWGGNLRSRAGGDRTAEGGARIGQAMETTLGNLEDTFRALDPARVADAVRAMRLARRVYVTGYRAALSIAYYFHYFGRMALPEMVLAPRQANAAVDELMEIEAGDVLVAVTFNPYSKETIEACHFATEQGARLVMISDSELITPDLAPDFLFSARVKGAHPLASFTAAMGLVDILIGELIASEGDAAHERIREYEAMRDRFSAYWRRQGGS